MLTTDPKYQKPLLPIITIRNTANSSTLYTYSAFTGTATGISTVFPLYCSVTLSQNTHAEFTIQFEDQTKQMQAAGVTVGSRVIILATKSGATTIRNLISGLVRKKGYSRGANNKILYTISGASTGIRLNELVTYNVSEAARLSTGQIDLNDASRKADTLLASGLGGLTSDGILSIANLASNSNVETFIPSIAIEYGELQDVVNYIEDQSGGELVVEDDLLNFRYELRLPVGGRGFTIKNSDANKANDDADDTMYLVHKNWTYEDSFYKSDVYSNRLYAILPPETEPVTDSTNLGKLGAVRASRNDYAIAVKFRPNHTHWLPGDIYLGAMVHTAVDDGIGIVKPVMRICRDSGGLPQNAGGIIATVYFTGISVTTNNQNETTDYIISNEWGELYGPGLGSRPDFIDLSTVEDYWLIMQISDVPIPSAFTGEAWIDWAIKETGTGIYARASPFAATHTNGGSGWSLSTGRLWYEMPRRRSHAFVMHDPKAIQAVQSGLTAGLPTDVTLSDISPQIRTQEAMARHLSQQLYTMARPRTTYNFPSVMAPNIPPFPGDPIIISDTVLGFSTSGQQIVQTTCGDMTYTWGQMDRGEYAAPTILSINAVGVHSRYR